MALATNDFVALHIGQHRMTKVPFRIKPMLATLEATPFTRPNWTFEEKYDGVRMLAYKETSRVGLISRNAIDRSEPRRRRRCGKGIE